MDAAWTQQHHHDNNIHASSLALTTVLGTVTVRHVSNINTSMLETDKTDDSARVSAALTSLVLLFMATHVIAEAKF